jgi:hypothetical protein
VDSDSVQCNYGDGVCTEKMLPANAPISRKEHDRIRNDRTVTTRTLLRLRFTKGSLTETPNRVAASYANSPSQSDQVTENGPHQ